MASTTATSPSLDEKTAASATVAPVSITPLLTVTTTTTPPAATLSPEKSTLTATATGPYDGVSLHTTSSLQKPSQELRRDDGAISTPHSYTGGNPFDTDIEAIIPASSSQEHCVRKSTSGARNDCQVWPGKEHWKKKAKAAKINNRSCACMARLSKRTRMIVKILIGLLIVGIAVGVGFGVSKPLGAPIWGKPADQK